MAPPDTVRFGSAEAPRPDWVPRDVADKANAWFAFGEYRIAQGFDALGYSRVASDRAAAAGDRRGRVGRRGCRRSGRGGRGGSGVRGRVRLIGAGAGALVGTTVLGFGALPGAIGGGLIGCGLGAGAVGVPAALAGAAVGGPSIGTVAAALGSGVNASDTPPPPLVEVAPAGPAPAPMAAVELPSIDFPAMDLPAVDVAAVVDSAPEPVVTTARQVVAEAAPVAVPVTEQAVTQVSSTPQGAQAVASLREAVASVPPLAPEQAGALTTRLNDALGALQGALTGH